MADDAAKIRLANTKTEEVIRLWPDGAPTSIPGVGTEATFSPPHGLAAGTTMLRNISDPTLTVFAPQDGPGNGVGVVVVPGGGWRILAWQHEGLDVARWLTGKGYTVFLLKYRVMGTPDDPDKFIAALMAQDSQLAAPLPALKAPRMLSDLANDDALVHAREIAADDGRRALAVAREKGASLGLKPEKIGMIGFSAGAFLVADVAMEPKGEPPAFVAPIYGGDTRGRPVPAGAPPLFTTIAHDDRLLFRMVEGLYLAWTDADRSAELHIFARGAHGFGMVRQGLPSDRWTELFTDWLADKGFA
jgi:acetyl esterase/lipase